MGRPVDMDAIVNSATSPEVAAEIYLASLLAIDVNTMGLDGDALIITGYPWYQN